MPSVDVDEGWRAVRSSTRSPERCWGSQLGEMLWVLHRDGILAHASICVRYRACMAQLSIRASDDLVRRVKPSATRVGCSMSDYITALLDVATDRERADTTAELVRERLGRAGLLVTRPACPLGDPSPDAIAAAGARAATGRALCEFVADGRWLSLPTDRFSE